MNNFKKQSGFSILEVTVVIFIVIVALIGMLSLASQSIKGSNYNKNELIASQLAQEGIEMVRNIRDTNWITAGNDWALGDSASSNSDIVQDGTYAIDGTGIDYAVDDFSALSGAQLYINSGGNYVHDDVGNRPTPFSRLITIANWDSYSDYLEVKCEVQWTEREKTNRYVVSTVLYNWR